MSEPMTDQDYAAKVRALFGRVKWWQAWAGAVLAVMLPFPWSLIAAAPCAVLAGWRLTDRTCGWCGRQFHGDDWCCDECAASREFDR